MLLRRNQELAALNEIGHELSKLVEPTEIAKLIHSMIGKVVDNRSLYVALYDEQRQEVSFPVYTVDGEPYHSPTRTFGRGLTEHIIRTKTPLLITRDLKATLEQLGLLKMDFLGLINLSILGRTVENIRKSRGTEIDVQSIPQEGEKAKKAFDLLSRGDKSVAVQGGAPEWRTPKAGIGWERDSDRGVISSVGGPGPSPPLPEGSR